MVYFQTKNSNLGKFWRVLQWKMLPYFMDIWSILRPFDTFLMAFCVFGGNLVYFPPILVNCTEKNLATLRRPMDSAPNYCSALIDPFCFLCKAFVGRHCIG
jgi:hypothetical protein